MTVVLPHLRKRRPHKKNTARGRALIALAESGARFGRLVCQRVVPHNGVNQIQCICDCGRTTIQTKYSLERGKVVSCGCHNAEMRKKSGKNLRHGHSARKTTTTTYHVWVGMLQRCNNPLSTAYPGYGGRGIKVCERWRTFDNFLADMGERPAGKTLGRIDNDGDYCPENCRWETWCEQQNNRRSNHFVEHDGLRLTLSMWARRVGLNPITLRTRVAKGVPFPQALGPLLKKRRQLVTA